MLNKVRHLAILDGILRYTQDDTVKSVVMLNKVRHLATLNGILRYTQDDTVKTAYSPHDHAVASLALGAIECPVCRA